MDPHGYAAIVLHAHLPFVRHAHGAMEEDWLFEAMLETYLPLVQLIEGWEADGVPYRLTLSVTPPLIAMLRDPLLQHRFTQYADNLQQLVEAEQVRTAGDPGERSLAQMYGERIAACLETYSRHDGDLVGALGRMAAGGRLELIGSCATHAFLPLLEPVPNSIRAQIEVGLQAHEAAFGRRPDGFWLPECGVTPAIAGHLARAGVRYSIVETHGLGHAVPRPRYGVYAPIVAPDGLALFGRDVPSSKQVWSAREGYPGDPWYRDFYRDIGFDLDETYLRPYLRHGVRAHTGLKYRRITGPGADKALYDPEKAAERTEVHAGNFIFNREHHVRHLAAHMDRPPVIVAPYDAELFGHWWYEGPRFLDHVMRRLARHTVLQPVLLSSYLDMHPRNQVAVPSTSSWGYGGYHEVWLEGSNDWIYRHVHEAGRRMVDLVSEDLPQPGPQSDRMVAQAARELLLAQASDWAFIMKTGTMVPYAVRRTKGHLARFFELADAVRDGRSVRLEEPAIFPDLQPSVFSPQPALPVGERQPLAGLPVP